MAADFTEAGSSFGRDWDITYVHSVIRTSINVGHGAEATAGRVLSP